MKKRMFLLAALVFGCVLSAADLLQEVKTGNIRIQSGQKGNARAFQEKGRPVLEITGIPYNSNPKRNQYIVFSIHLPQAVSLEKKTLKLEIACEGDPAVSAIYVRAYNGNDKTPAWSFVNDQRILGSSPQMLHMTAKRNRLMKWQDKVVNNQPANNIRRLEFHFSTPRVNSPQKLRITRLEVVPELDIREDVLPRGAYNAYNLPLPELTKAVELSRATVLVKDRKPCFVLLHPDSDAGKKAAARVAAAVHQATGVKVTPRPGTAGDRVPGQTAIMMGNLFSNTALQVLYARYQTAVDEFFPGKGGYTIESIPEAFVRNQDVIVLGASCDEGLAKAADAFAELVKKHGKPGSLVLPHVFQSRPAESIKPPRLTEDYIRKGIQTAHDRLRTGAHTSLGGHLSQIAISYLKFRNPLDAKLYVEVAKIYAASAKGDPRKFGGPWGFDSDFPSFEAINGWDLMEHDPALSADDRLAASNMILRWTHEAIFDEARGGIRKKGPVGNHLTHCSIGAMASALYFGKYYSKELVHPEIWMDGIKKNFARQYVHGKAMDDCDSYQWLTWRHVLLYAMALPDYTVFRNGVADRILKVAGITMDNLGAQAPYGDTNGWRSSNSHVIVLRMLYAATGNPLANHMLRMKSNYIQKVGFPGQYIIRMPEVKTPTELDGVQIIRMDPGYYDYAWSSGGKIPLAKTFDKFSFREKLDPQALYLLVDGVNNGGHGHNDGNSVLRYSQFGREWLAENEYVKNQQKYHNSLLVYRNGEAYLLPDYMELADRQETADFTLITVRANRLGTSDWTRYYIWFKNEKAWMLIDELFAREAASFRLIQRWNGVGERTVKPDGYELEQQGAKVRMQTSADVPLSTYDDADLGRQWVNYSLTTPVIRVMDQTLEKDLAAGEKVRMAALWHGAASGNVPEWAVDRIGNGFKVHTGKTVYTLTVDDAGKLLVRKSAADKPVPARRNLAQAAAKAKAPDAPVQWQVQCKMDADNAVPLTDRVIRKKIPVKLTGTKPGTGHLFFPSAANNLFALIDGSWSEGSDSVMFARDRIAVLNFNFKNAQKISAVELQTWWGTSSRFADLPFGVRDMEVQLSNDNFRKDIRKAAFRDSSGDRHTGFGSTIPYTLTFAEQEAKQVRVIVRPPEGGALYLGEIRLLGTPPAGVTVPVKKESFSKVIRVSGKGGDYLAAGSLSGLLQLMTPAGKKTASYKLSAGINDLAAVDVDKDGNPELVLACQDGTCRVVRPDGKQVWRFKFPYYRKFPVATIVRVADLEGDGEKEIIVGCDNWRTYVLNLKGKEIWNYEVIRETRAVQIVDLDGDGKQELICGTAYMKAVILNCKGYRLVAGGFGNGCRATAAPLNGDGRNRNVVVGFDNGKILFRHRQKAAEFASFFAGDEIFMMTETPEVNGKQDVYACSYNGFVYRFTADGKLVWNRAMPASVVRIATLPDGGLAAGTIAGDVCILSPDGKMRYQNKLEGAVTGLTVDASRLLVTTDKGVVAALGL